MLQHLWESCNLLENTLRSTHQNKTHGALLFTWNNRVSQMKTKHAHVCNS